MKMFSEFLNESNEHAFDEILSKLKELKELVKKFVAENCDVDTIVKCNDDDAVKHRVENWFKTFMQYESNEPDDRLTVEADGDEFVYNKYFQHYQVFFHMEIWKKYSEIYSSSAGNHINVGFDGSKLMISFTFDYRNDFYNKLRVKIIDEFDPTIDTSRFRGALKLSKYDI